MRFHARGGLGEVLLAQDSELNRAVALKRILPEAARDPEAHQRFLLEAQITGRLEHPGIVPVYGLGVDPQSGQPCYAMRFITGRSLRTAIEEFHQSSADFESLAFRKLLQGVISVCQTISYAHSRGVLHRDVKPSNVMLGRHGETLVVDWGLAKVLEEPTASASRDASLPSDASSSRDVSLPRDVPLPRDASGSREMPEAVRSSSSSSLSGSATLGGAGTPGYMAPEQAAGELRKLGPAADVYGLGATLYHLLVGEGPLQRESTLAAMSRTLTGEVPSARRLNPAVPRGLEAVARKAMSLEPSRRYASAEAMAADLERWLADEPLSCQREGRVLRLQRWVRRHPTGVATTLAVMMLAGFGAIAVAALVNTQRSALDSKNAQILAERDRALEAQLLASEQLQRARTAEQQAESERDRAVLSSQEARAAEKLAASERDRALAAERAAAADRDRAVLAEKRAAASFEEARAVLRECLDLARGHPVFQKPGMQEPRELLLRAAAPFHDRLATVGKTAELRHEAVVAKFEAAMQSAKTKNQAEALALYRRSIAELDVLVTENPGVLEYRTLMISCYNNTGNLLRLTGDTTGARKAFTEAMTRTKAALAERPDVAFLRHQLGSIHNNLGATLRESGELVPAEREIQLGLELHRALLTANPGNPQIRADVAGCLTNLGLVYLQLGNIEAAERETLACRAEWETLIKQRPEVVEFRMHLASTHQNLSSVYRNANKLSEAEEQTRASMAIFKALAEQNPALVELRSRLAADHKVLSILLLRAGKPDEALREARAGLELTRVLAEQNPQTAYFRAELADSQTNLGILLMETDKRPEAAAQLRTSLTLLDKLCLEAPQSLDFHRKRHVANMILAAAILDSDPAQAVTLLRTLPPEFYVVIRGDKRFDPLRSRPDFQAMLAEWERVSPSKK